MSDFGYGNGLGYGEAQGGGFYRFEVRNAFMSHRLAGAHCLPFSVDFRFYLVLAYSFAFGNVFLDDAVVDRLFFIQIQRKPLPPALGFRQCAGLFLLPILLNAVRHLPAIAHRDRGSAR